MKNKFLKALTTCVLTGSVASSLATLGACGTTSKVVNKIDTPFSTNNQSEYCVVHFIGGPGVTFLGQTEVKVPTGSFFASVNTPVAQHGQLKFDCWSEQANIRKPISPRKVIDTDCNVYPFFQEETDLSKCVGMAAIEQTTITVAHKDKSTDPIKQSIEFSTSYGETWTNINNAPNHAIELAPGDTVFFKGDNKSGLNNDDDDDIYFDVSNGGEINIVGSIMGLLDDATGKIVDIPSEYCFEGLFMAHDNTGGIKYVSSSFLPATNLQLYCYKDLFSEQMNLMTAPWLPATELKYGCYENMFFHCEQLDFIKISYNGGFKQDEDYPYTKSWLMGVETAGTIIYDGNDVADKGENSIPTTWTCKKAPTPDPEKYYIIDIECDDEVEGDSFVKNHPYQFTATVPGGDDVFQDVTWVSSDTSVATVNPSTGVVTPIKANDSCQIIAYSKVDQNVAGMKEITVRDIRLEDCAKFSAVNGNATISWDYGGTGVLPNFKYSYDGKNWFNFTTAVTISQDTPIYVKGNNPNGIGDSSSHTRFIFDGSVGDVSISGKLNALVDDARGTMKTIPHDYCFNELFANNTKLKHVDSQFLSYFDTLSVGCYKSMFQYCDNLDEVPSLPNENLSNECYLYMFRGCTSLTKAPELPATTLANHCYKGMFSGCTSLTQTSELKATTPTLQCYYQMFSGCTSLKTIKYIHLNNFPTTIDYLWCCMDMFYKVSPTLFTKDPTDATLFFTCPTIEAVTDFNKYNPVGDMFTFNDKLEPTSNEDWYFKA